MKHVITSVVALFIAGLIVAVASAAAGSRGHSPRLELPIFDEAPEAGPLSEPMLPVTSGEEPAIFSSNVKAADSGGVTVEWPSLSVDILERRSAKDDVCYLAERGVHLEEGCLDVATLQSGLGYSAFRAGDGPVEMLGIVPDDVTQVQIAGETIAVRDNTWTFVGTPDEDLSFVVLSEDGRRTAGLG